MYISRVRSMVISHCLKECKKPDDITIKIHNSVVLLDYASVFLLAMYKVTNWDKVVEKCQGMVNLASICVICSSSSFME